MNTRLTCCLITLLGVLALQPAAHASFHLMQIEQVIGGINGDATAQAIQLRMRAAGQTFVSAAKLVVFDAAGQNPITILDVASNVANGALGDHVLIASANFPSHTMPAAVPDFTLAHLIPASYFSAGSLVWESDSGIIYWRLSWGGAAYTGSNAGSALNDDDGNFGPPFGGPLPSSGASALQFQGSAAAKSTSNAADYLLIGSPVVFVNNAGASFTVIAPSGSATWLASPPTGNWNHAANWTPATIPNGPSDMATFASSNKTGVSLSANTEVNGIVFNPGASAFTIDSAGQLVQITGVGITNNSGIAQNFVSAINGGAFFFEDSATAGSLTTFTNNTDINGGAGSMAFYGTATAGNGTFNNNEGGLIDFHFSSTAGNGIFTNNGGAVSGAFGGSTRFFNTSTAGNAVLIANRGLSGGGGGLILFFDDSTGGAARVEVFGNGTGDSTNGTLDISSPTIPGVTIGSIEGSGTVFLGANELTVGGNNLSTTFSGVIQDGGSSGGTGGSLTKVGKGKLSLTKANTYTGGTTITKGTLLVKNKTGSATGTGAVHVNAGTLGGTGKIAGAVTLGTGSGTGAFLSPGNSATKPGTLTINNNTLTFNSDATYKCALDRSIPKATKVAAKGVTINSAAQFAFADLNTGTLTTGTVFTVINNTSSAAISGTFTNLANGATFTSTGGTTFKASYTGGTGNDLTLTVQ